MDVYADPLRDAMLPRFSPTSPDKERFLGSTADSIHAELDALEQHRPPEVEALVDSAAAGVLSRKQALEAELQKRKDKKAQPTKTTSKLDTSAYTKVQMTAYLKKLFAIGDKND